jgi:anti-sigma regulatory factor (Ser/Thr protein kinase)
VQNLMPTGELVLRFAATVAGLEEAGIALRRLLDARRLDHPVRYHVELAFEEIAANIVRYSQATREVEVAVELDGDEILLTFQDDGEPFDPRAQPEPRHATSLEDARPGGFGLPLVRKISSRMDYRRTDQQRNRLTIAIPAR